MKSKPKMAQYLVRSNVHTMNLDTAINRLLSKERFIDVTLACDGHRFHCHRLVLAASSPLFEELLMENPTTHPIVIIPGGIKSVTLKSVIDFMYKGQTNVSQIGLKALMESAELLQVTGLQYADTEFQEYYEEDIGEDMNQEEDNQAYQDPQIQQKQIHESEYQQQATGNEDIANGIEAVNTQDQMSEQTIVDVIEIEDSQDVPNANEEVVDIENSTTVMTNGSHAPDNTETDANINNAIPTTSDSKTKYIAIINNNDGTVTQDTKLLQSSSPQPQSLATSTPTIRVKPTIKLINLFKLTGRPTIGGKTPSTNGQVPWTYIHIPKPPASQVASASTQVPSTSVPVPSTKTQVSEANELPLLRTISKPQANTSKTIHVADSDTISTPVSSFLKFNSSTMAISVKNLDRTDTQEMVKVVNMAEEPEAVTPARADVSEQAATAKTDVKNEFETSPESNYIELGETKICEADFPMFYAMIKKEREDQAAQLAKEKQEADETPAETEAENIICQPNVSYIYGGAGDDVAETYGNDEEQVQVHQQATKPKRAQRKRQLKPKNLNEPPYFSSDLLPKSHRLRYPPTLLPLSRMPTDLGPKELYYSHTDEKSKIIFHQDKSDFNLVSNSTPRGGETHSPQTVILRNPRCNQPRHYSTESLFNALMAVKYGESIYRASRMHQVPRKTLRNWMKRWDIKSQFPMPKQLEDAAKKKRQNQNT